MGVSNLIVTLLACGGGPEFAWDANSGSDLAEDIAVAVFTDGKVVEGDPGLLAPAHATGTALHMTIRDDGEEDDIARWKVESTNPAICGVSLSAGDGWLDVDLSFLSQGDTDLYVIDDEGAVRDWQAISVRDPEDTRVFTYEALATGDTEPVTELHVVPQSAATIAVAWLDNVGDALAGLGVLSVAADGDGLTAAADTAADTGSELGEAGLESFLLIVGEDAPVGEGSVALSSTTDVVDELAVYVHDGSEITGVSLLYHQVASGEGDSAYSATVRAVVEAGEVDLTAARVTWSADGEEVGKGTWVQLGGDRDLRTELEACRKELCASQTVQGEVEFVGQSIVADDCGCASSKAGEAGVLLAGGLALVLGRRNRGSPATNRESTPDARDRLDPGRFEALMQFMVGDRAVYPAHGVGIIRDVESREIDGEKVTVYVLKILDNGMTIRVPVQNARSNGLRPVISAGQVDKVYDILRDRDVPTDNQTWNRRYREYTQKIKTGDPLEVAKVLRDLALLKGDKALSFGERKMFDHARSLLVQEIAVARDADEKLVGEEIDRLFAGKG